MGYDVFKFGALYWNDDVQPIPQNPSYTGDIPQYDNIKAISIKEAEQKITWIKPYGLNLLVADRVLMANTSWEDLQRSGLDKGIPILVGGQRFLCRMPQVGLLGDENEWKNPSSPWVCCGPQMGKWRRHNPVFFLWFSPCS